MMGIIKACVCFFVMALAVGGGLYLHCQLLTKARPKDENDWHDTYYAWYYPLSLVSLCVGLVTAAVILVYIMNLYFDQRLKQEVCRIQVMIFIFTIAYLTRAATYATTQFFVDDPDTFRISTTYFCSYLVWDVLPLTVIMIYHNKNIIKEKPRPTSEDLLEAQNNTMTNTNSSQTNPVVTESTSCQLKSPNWTSNSDMDELAILGNPEYTAVLV